MVFEEHKGMQCTGVATTCMFPALLKSMQEEPLCANDATS